MIRLISILRALGAASTLLLVFAILVLPAAAACTGRNLIDALPADEAAALRAVTEAIPYSSGLLWQARRGDDVVTLIGTYHFDDPRHAPLVAAVQPILQQAQVLLVEAGPEEQAALKHHLARDPSLMIITEGPTLLEQLPPDDWRRLADAMALRGVPGIMAAKLRPWYASMLLGMAPCDMEQIGSVRGLDARLIAEATTAAIPVRALEPYDTLFALFDAMNPQEQLDMITSTLAMDDRAADLSVTLADSYFAGQTRIIWEYIRAEALKEPGATPEQVAQESATMEEALMNRRNRAWLPVIEASATQGPVVAAFGALHLSGHDGVLNLLARAGFTITPVALP